MRISLRAALGLAFAAGLTMTTGLPASRAATPIEKTLPGTTLGFLKIEDAAKLARLVLGQPGRSASVRPRHEADDGPG